MYVQMTKMYHILATKGKYTIAIDFIFFKWKANPPPYCANFHTVASSPTVPSRPALTPSLLRSCSTSLGVHGPAGGGADLGCIRSLFHSPGTGHSSPLSAESLFSCLFTVVYLVYKLLEDGFTPICLSPAECLHSDMHIFRSKTLSVSVLHE